MYSKPNDYVKDAILTASPTQRLLMFLDRLEIDMKRAEIGFDEANVQIRNDALIHAQEIVLHLRDSLRPDIWDGAIQLASVYGFIYSELVYANMRADKKRFDVAYKLILQIIMAWRGAANQIQGEGASVGVA